MTTTTPARRLVVNSPDDPTTVVLRYVDAFNNADPNAMAALCPDPMQILDGMSPHVWHGPTASEDWWRDVREEGERTGASGYHIAVGRPRHAELSDNRIHRPSRTRVHLVTAKSRAL
ncbi:hypothetical protein [Nocardia gamkensis]|uniref:hypothetical protein n=1 Tax=Nocardia gamkensis TaxID=352869 RepID=UPI0037C82A05